MLQEIKQHLAENFPFLQEKKILIAISGGVDSVVLTELFHQLKYSISLAHCNFNLREKESDLDEEFVKAFATKLECTFFTKSFNTVDFASKNKQSTQIAARNLRYFWFEELIEEHDFDYILTAHHADDNLETFVINLSRGSGLDGFTGIPAKNGKIIRPLLVFSRDRIETYAKKNGIEWREDKSNATTKYTRNKIRHNIIPVLKEINPSILDSFSKTIQNLQESNQIISDSMAKIISEITEKEVSENVELKINIKKLCHLSNPKAYLYQILKNCHFPEWNDVVNLLSAQSGKQVFSESYRLIKGRDFLFLSKIKTLEASEDSVYYIDKKSVDISEPISLKLENVTEFSTENKQVIQLDKNTLKFPLKIRKPKNGDYFYPTGMQGKKKVRKFFKDEKLTVLEKENIWLLCNYNNDVIWIIGKRQDRRFAAQNSSENILKIITN